MISSDLMDTKWLSFEWPSSWCEEDKALKTTGNLSLDGNNPFSNKTEALHQTRRNLLPEEFYMGNSFTCKDKCL